MAFNLKKLGPGLLFAGAAIGVSHLVQSTRAGADYGFGLVWALLLIHLIKYPFFQFGPRYASVTGLSLLDGYKTLGRGFLALYFAVNLLTMFTIQAAVTIVCAGIAAYVFDFGLSVNSWAVIITAICLLILLLGRFTLLDKLMKVIIVVLSLTTLAAVISAFGNGITETSLPQTFPMEGAGVAFLIAFMGWMPAPLDISIWQSLWTQEKAKTEQIETSESLLDFNIGYAGTIILGLGFISLGALVMYGSGQTFSSSGVVFAQQLIDMYTGNLGSWAFVIIGIAAFTTMFSTTLTTLDASPRAMAKTMSLLGRGKTLSSYTLWLLILASGTILIFIFLTNEMTSLVQLATVLSFLTAPLYAVGNYLVMTGKTVPFEKQPKKPIKALSVTGIILLFAFSLWYIYILI
ncbi:MAG: divalent metal cation transporter [Leeuwenhoekiella sp.]